MAFNSSAKRAIDIIVPSIGLGIVGLNYIGRKGDRDIKYILFVMILVGVALYAITSQTTSFLLARALSGVKPKEQEAIMDANGVDSKQFEVLQAKAKTIYGAFHDSTWTEDEDLAINTFNECTTPQEVKTVCDIYYKLYGKSIKAEFDAYVTYMDTFANPLKNVIKENWY